MAKMADPLWEEKWARPYKEQAAREAHTGYAGWRKIPLRAKQLFTTKAGLLSLKGGFLEAFGFSDAPKAPLHRVWGRQRFFGGMGRTGAGIMGRAFAPLQLGFTLEMMHQGWQEGGLVGVAGALAKETAILGGMRAGMYALGNIPLFAGTAGAARMAMSAAARIAGPIALPALAGYGAYKATTALAKFGEESRRLDMATDMSAHMTNAAYTQRQRSLQEIGRSHGSSRLALGNEAVMLHI